MQEDLNLIDKRSLTPDEIQFQIEKYRDKYKIDIKQYNFAKYIEEYEGILFELIEDEREAINSIHNTLIEEENKEIELLNEYKKALQHYENLGVSKYITMEDMFQGINAPLNEIDYNQKILFKDFVLNKLEDIQKELTPKESKVAMFYINTNYDNSAYHGSSFIITKDKFILFAMQADYLIFFNEIINNTITELTGEGAKIKFDDLQKDFQSCHVLGLKTAKQMLRNDGKLLNTFIKNHSNFDIANHPDIAKYMQSCQLLKNENIMEKPMNYGKVNMNNLQNYLNERGAISEFFYKKTSNIKIGNNTLRNAKRKISEECKEYKDERDKIDNTSAHLNCY